MDAPKNTPATLAMPTKREIVITRVFDAPRELVWQAWTDPGHVRAWWGPLGFSNPACEMDLRVDGVFLLHMRGPDGIGYPCRGIYREIKAPERIVYESEADDIHPCGGGLPPRALVTVTFAEQDGGTALTIHTRFPSAEGLEAAAKMGFNAGWAGSLERLAECLQSFETPRA